MTQELDDLYPIIKQAAVDRGLVVFDGLPNVLEFPGIVAWKGDWRDFLDCAIRAHVTLLYLKEWRYDPEGVVEEVILEELGHRYVSNDSTESGDDEAETESDSTAWLRTRLLDAIAPWLVHRGEVSEVSSIWIKEGVVHLWSHEADWYPGHHEALDAALAEARQVAEQDRVLRSEEKALKIHEYAEQMAHHSRFPEAKSQEKRAFMAMQLFPDIADDDWPERLAASIAKRAELIYWWDIEPIEKVSKAERAKELYTQGESIRNIAAMLKMSEAKVRAAISEEG